jgi:hypothetical protein
MTLTTGTAGPLLTPEQVESLLSKPVLAASVALNPLCSWVLRPTAPSVRPPAVTADPTAAWVAEGAEIPVSDLQTAEVDVVTKKVAGLSVVTSELVEDSSPEATAEVGRGLARDIARKVDAAFFGDGTANGDEQPDGLAALTVGAGGVQDIAAGTAPTNLDAFPQAQMLSANVGAQLTAFVANTTTALVLANMKEASGPGRPLLQPDPTQPTRRMIFGVPLLTSPEPRSAPSGACPPSGRHRRPPRRRGQGRPVGVLHQRPGRRPGHLPGRLRLPSPGRRGPHPPRRELTGPEVPVGAGRAAVLFWTQPAVAPWHGSGLGPACVNPARGAAWCKGTSWAGLSRARVRCEHSGR